MLLFITINVIFIIINVIVYYKIKNDENENEKWEPNYALVGVEHKIAEKGKDIIMHHIQMISIYAHFSCLLSQKGHLHHPIHSLQL